MSNKRVQIPEDYDKWSNPGQYVYPDGRFIYTRVQDCVYCGETHELLATGFTKGPITDSEGDAFDYWAICPETGDLLLVDTYLAGTDAAERVEGKGEYWSCGVPEVGRFISFRCTPGLVSEVVDTDMAYRVQIEAFEAPEFCSWIYAEAPGGR